MQYLPSLIGKEISQPEMYDRLQTMFGAGTVAKVVYMVNIKAFKVIPSNAGSVPYMVKHITDANRSLETRYPWVLTG